MTMNKKAIAGAKALLEAIGWDVQRRGCEDTPSRMAAALAELAIEPDRPAKIAALFRSRFPADGYDELVIVQNIKFVSLCEHHALPFEGVACVGYLPAQWLLGISKLPRLVQLCSRSLQMQERLTWEIASYLRRGLKPRGVGVILKARHVCMSCRGAKADGANLVTSCVFGAIRRRVRSEFLRLSGMTD
jgi:GTP cyclohydrolase I